jgi:hypothetical protein
MARFTHPALLDSGSTYEGTWTVQGGTTETQPTFSGAPLFTGQWVRIENLVHFEIQVDMDNITNFGTGQYYVMLPFAPVAGYQFREGCVHDISTGRQYSVGGHAYINNPQLLLNFTDTNGRDSEFTHNTPFVLSTEDNFHISGTYLAVPQ